MKKYLFFVLLAISIFLTKNTKAQLFFGGNISVFARNGETTNSTRLYFTPRAGYFINDNFACGGELIVDLTKTTYDNSDQEYTSNGFGFGGFARFYGSGMEKIRLFGQGYGQVIFYNTNDVSSTTLMLGIRPAIEFSLSDHFKLEIMAGNLGLDFDISDNNNEINFSLFLNSLNFGLTYHL